MLISHPKEDAKQRVGFEADGRGWAEANLGSCQQILLSEKK